MKVLMLCPTLYLHRRSPILWAYLDPIYYKVAVLSGKPSQQTPTWSIWTISNNTPTSCTQH